MRRGLINVIDGPYNLLNGSFWCLLSNAGNKRSGLQVVDELQCNCSSVSFAVQATVTLSYKCTINTTAMYLYRAPRAYMSNTWCIAAVATSRNAQTHEAPNVAAL